MAFEALLDNRVEQETLFSEDLWRDDYALPSLDIEETKTVDFASLYKTAQDYYAAILRAFDMPRVCVYCQTRYYEKDNIGQLRCVYHPLVPRDGEYICCSSSANKGCRACDHTSEHPNGPRWTNENVQIKIPAVLQSYFHYNEGVLERTVESTNPLYSYDVVNRVAERL